MNRGLLDRFYKGECSQEEVQTVLKWFRDKNLDPKQEKELYAMWQEVGKEAAKEEQRHDAGKVFQNIRAQIQEQQQEEPAASQRFLQLNQPSFWLRVAAVLLPLCIALALFRYAPYHKEEVSYMTVEAAPGIKKTISLPDGSLIRLNSGSRVTFHEKFGGERREIDLEGEAFFEVAKDSLRPFIVRTGSITTQALGTSFNIDNSLGNGDVIIALATGKVRVDKQGPDQKQTLAELHPGQQISYSKEPQQYKVSDYHRREVLAWKDGVLLFRSADMDQVIRKLENWYGVDITIDTRGMPQETWDYSGEYNNESLEKVLEGIGFVKGFSYSLAGKKVMIKFNSYK